MHCYFYFIPIRGYNKSLKRLQNTLFNSKFHIMIQKLESILLLVPGNGGDHNLVHPSTGQQYRSVPYSCMALQLLCYEMVGALTRGTRSWLVSPPPPCRPNNI
jgi:hypothetical protein